MTLETAFDLEGLGMRMPGGTADQGFGSMMSRSYASNVPVYFRRGNSAESGRTSSRNETTHFPEPKNSSEHTGKLETALRGLARMVDRYVAAKRKKPLVYTADFMKLKGEFGFYFGNISLPNQVRTNYKVRYDRIMQDAEKCKYTENDK